MAEHNVDIQIDKEGPITLVTISGALDSSNLRFFKNELDPLFADGANVHVLLDCEDLVYASSQVFGLLSCYNRASKTHKTLFAICRISSQMHNILDILGLLPLFATYSTREEALAEMSKKIADGCP